MDVDSGKRGPRAVDVLLLVLLASLPLLLFYGSVHLAGPQWDMTVRELSGRTLLNFMTHNVPARYAFAGEFSNNLLYYFEPYREPLATPIFALLLVFLEDPILAYMVIAYAGFLFTMCFLARELGASRLIMLAVVVNGYTAYYLFVPNGGEGLSLMFVAVGLVFLLRERPVSGLFFGIAALAKYPALAAFPLVLLLEGKRNKLKAIAWGAIALSAWGLMDYALYGVPFYSYLASISASNVASGASTVSLSALFFSTLMYPLIFLGIGIAFLMLRKLRVSLAMDHTAKVLLLFAVLSALAYAVMLPHNDPSTQARYGYLLSISLSLPVVLLLSRAVSHSRLLKYAVVLAAIAMLSFAVYQYYGQFSAPVVTYYNPSSANSIYAHAHGELSLLGYGNCRFISNAWVPMIYSGYDAYSPFVLYQSNTITPIVMGLIAGSSGKLNYSAYAKEMWSYPVVVIRYAGVSPSYILNLNSSSLVYEDQNVSVYLPQNASCYSP